jgi:hypothetical protein
MLSSGLRGFCVPKQPNMPKLLRVILIAGAILVAHSAFAQTWTQLTPSGTPPAARGNTTGVYDPASDRMIVFGGRDAAGNNRNDVWALAHANGEGATGRWIRLIADAAAGSPPARSGHSAVYDTVNNRMIIFGGCSANCAPVLNDVWVLANANGIGGTPAWTQLQLSGGPAPRTNAAAGYDPAHNELVIFGGQDGSSNPCSTFSDTWILTPANGLAGPGAWAEAPLNPAIPAGQNGVAAAFASGALNLFGGTGMVNGTCTVTNTTWFMFGPFYFTVAQYIPQGPTPSARSFASLVVDSISGQSLVFGGLDASGNYLNDVWNFFGAWNQITPKNSSPPARSGQAAVFDSAHQRMTIFGGSDASDVLNDTWVLHAPEVSELTCIAGGGAPNPVRAEGIAEQVGDLILNCTNGTPTPQGDAIPEYTISLTLNTDVTSRLLPEAAGLSEALLMIDDPFPASPSPPPPSSLPPGPNAPPQNLCTPLGSDCTATGTGGTPSPYQTQPNVFVGKQDGASRLYWKVPIDPPGANVTRVIRITNVRANASQLPVSTGLIPTMVQATVEIQGTPAIPLADPQALLMANSVQGVLASVISTASIPQCEPHNAGLLQGSGTAAFDFSVQVQEGFAAAFKYRNYGTYVSGPVFPPVLVEQNVPGFNYWTETGFYSPSLFTSAPMLGLADFGTRIRVALGPVSSGTELFVPTEITLTGEYAEGSPAGQLQLVQTNEYGNSEPGYEPVAPTETVGRTLVAEASASGSTAYAVYEVIYADPSVVETATIPVAVAFTNVPSTGAVSASMSFAPLSSVGTASQTAPIPRFTNFSTAQAAYSITSCQN